jgi:four helix bundle protein
MSNLQNPNTENRNSKQIRNANVSNAKPYDLEDRTFQFAKRVAQYVNALPRITSNVEIASQLMRASGSVGANYIEANESLGNKDFLMYIKISRKESKESGYWLRLSIPKPEMEQEQSSLIQESTELMKIFGSILHKST